MAFKQTARVKTPSNKIKSYTSGWNATSAEAAAELKALLKMVVGTLLGVSESTELADITGYPMAAGTFEDATLVLAKPNGLGILTPKPIKIENMSLAYLKPFTKGEIDVSNADIAAYVAAYRGPSGGGWTLASSGNEYEV